MGITHTPQPTALTLLWLLTFPSPLCASTAEGRFEPTSPTTYTNHEATTADSATASRGGSQPVSHEATAFEGGSQAGDVLTSTPDSVPSTLGADRHSAEQGSSYRGTLELSSAGSSPRAPFLSHVVMDSASVHQCLQEGATREYHAHSLEVVLHRNSSDPERSSAVTREPDSHLQCHLDLVVPDDQVVKIQVVNFTSRCDTSVTSPGGTPESCQAERCDSTRGVRIVERAGRQTLVHVCQSTAIPGEFSSSPRVSVHINTHTPGVSDYPDHRLLSLHLKLTAVAPAQQLEVVTEGEFKGHVQTPRWDGQVNYPRSMKSQVSLAIPPGHRVMLSFPSVQLGSIRECDQDRLRVHRKVFNGRFTFQKLVTTLCGDYVPPPPQVLTAQALVFAFHCNRDTQHPGFRALFSFHAGWASPRQTSEGVWNCSVATWASFRQHFPCNLESNCLHSEDEAHCPYVSTSCGPGGIRAGRGCYVLRNLGQVKLSYGAMKERCQGRGHGSLVSLNTVQEWQDVWHVLRQGRWEKILVGLQPVPPTWPPMYRDSLYWADGSVAFYTAIFNIPQGDWCSFYVGHWKSPDLGGGRCNYVTEDKRILCELNITAQPRPPPAPIHLTPPALQPHQGRYLRCLSGHVTHLFLACDLDSHCWAESDSSAPCKAPLTSQPAVFSCAEGRVEGVPYSLVCDHRQDCGDGSDERFCSFPPCRAPEQFTCHNGQCIPADKKCDGQLHCWDRSHQARCYTEHHTSRSSKPPPGVVDMDSSGRLQVTKASPARGPYGGVVCADTHVQCDLPGYYCLPVYLRCNQVYDCPGGQDELDCVNATCPGFYRCRASQVCVHALHLCDGLFQCPQHDDEAGCGLTCPPSCVCHGLAFTCSAPFTSPHLPHLRYLQARGSFLTLAPLRNSTMLVYLGLAACNLTRLPPLVFPNLRHLDLSANRIAVLPSSHVTGCPHLHTLSLSANPLSQVLGVVAPQQPSCSLHSLDLSGTALQSLDTHNFTCFSRLRLLNLSGSGVQRVSPAGLRPFGRLEKVDLRGCAVRDFSRGLLERQTQLQALWADNYKLCCPAVLPAGFATANCFAPSDEISSCDTLLRSDFFRLFLYLYAFLALTGNAGSFLYRTFVSRAERKLGFGIFVAHLCLSDSLMGVYLAAIGVADRLYAGSYLWEDLAWRQSAVCQAAGFCSLLSSEVSTFLICLITVDRFLVLRFPFSRVRFRQRSAQAACVACWLTGLALALVPLLPPAAHWRFYQQSSICLPLPVTRQPFAGRPYSMGVMVLLNFILFLLIAAGQAFIYRAIGHNSLSLLDCSKSCSRDLTIARRLITVAMSDFLCWFPIGVLGLLASQDVPVPGEVRVGVAIFVLPLNSALNPFLYTLNIIREKRRQAYFTKLQALVQSQARAKGTTHQ
ncbi:hypothetical protein ACOMHN_038099 [Nucella lapillus]